MSYSPPIRRLSNTSSNSLSHKQSQDLINAYEAEEERIINVLSRKLEKLREEKIDLENALEAESESHVNRLSRELTLLRQQQQLQQQQNAGSNDTSPDGYGNGAFVAEPNAQIMLEAMRRENEQLRGKLVDTERDYVRVKRMNEVYREELIEHRRTLGLPVDNLIGLNSSDPYSQPNHRRSTSFSSQLSSNASSPTASLAAHPRHPASNGIPISIPRTNNNHTNSHLSSRHHNNTTNNPSSQSITPLSHSPDSPFQLFSPPATTGLHMPSSQTTHITTPSSVDSATAVDGSTAGSARALSYPSVPPPSLASSFGSPSVMYHHIPLEERNATVSRRNSNSTGAGVRGSRRTSVERGGRVAETGTLVPRSRAGSQSTAQALAITEEAHGD